MPSKLPQRHALVTGGCGFIGQHLVTRLLARGTTVTVLDDLSTGSRDNLPQHPDLTIVEGSVLEPAAVRRAATDTDIVFHLASMVGMRRVTQHPRRAFLISQEGTRTLLAETGDRPVMAFSSSSVYGLVEEGRVAEDDVRDGGRALVYDGGTPSYASGKWAMETLVLQAQAERPVMVIRPFNVIGEGQSGSYGMVVPRFIAQAQAGKPLTVYGNGRQERCFCCVLGFVDRILRLAELPTAWAAPNNLLNVGSDRPIAIGELAKLIADETGSSSQPTQIAYDTIYPGHRDVPYRTPCLDRVDALLGRNAWPDLRTLVRRLIAHAEARAPIERAHA